jgi:hypothetical protein
MVRRLFIVVLVLGVAAAAWAGWWLYSAEPEHEPPQQERADVVGAADDGWQQLAYQELRIEVPPDWVRLETSGCDNVAEHWGPTDLGPCASAIGVWFYASATFDPASGPGVHAVEPTNGLPDGGFGGYVTPGDQAVYAQDVDQEVVRRVLRSVSEPTPV